MNFVGYVSAGSALRVPFVSRTTADVPIDADSTPTYRAYGPSGVMANGTGSASFKDSGNITGATNANPIVITSAGHKLQTGMRVTITGVGGNTAANTTANITVVDSNSFSLDSVAGNGAYTSGGTWHVSGLYDVSITPQSADGYTAGEFYDLVCNWIVSGSRRVEVFRFGVY